MKLFMICILSLPIPMMCLSQVLEKHIQHFSTTISVSTSVPSEINLTKYVFGSSSLEFFRHLIDINEICLLHKKIQAIHCLIPPTSLCQL